MTENTEYPNAIGDVGILRAIDELMEKRNFSKSINPMFGTVRPISELASKYVKSALVNASKDVPGESADELNYYLSVLDPYYARMSTICKNQMMTDSVERALTGLTKSAGKRFLEEVGAIQKSAMARDGEGYYISAAEIESIAKAAEAGEPDQEEQPAEPELQPQPEPADFDLLNAKENAWTGSSGRRFRRSVRNASSVEEREALFNTWCEENGYTSAEMDARLKSDEFRSSPEGDTQRYRIRTNKDGNKVKIPMKGSGRTKTDTAAVSAYLEPYVYAKAYAGMLTNGDRSVSRWMKGLSPERKEIFDRVQGFKNLDKCTRASRWNTGSTVLNLESAISSLPTDEDKKAFAAMVAIDTIYKRQALDTHTNTHLNEMMQIVDSTIEGRPMKLQPISDILEYRVNLGQAKRYLKIIEDYAETHENAVVDNWLFKLWNTNQKFNKPVKNVHMDEGDEYSKKKAFIFEMDNKKAWGIAISPKDQAEYEKYKKELKVMDETRAEHKALEDEAEGDRQDLIASYTSQYQESDDPEWLRSNDFVNSKDQYADKRLHNSLDLKDRPMRTASEDMHLGNSEKARQYRTKVWALFKKDPFWRFAIDPADLSEDSQYISQNNERVYSDQTVQMLNLARKKDRPYFEKLEDKDRFYKDLVAQLTMDACGPDMAEKILYDDTNPRSIAEQGVEITPLAKENMAAGLIQAVYYSEIANEPGTAKRACGKAVQDINNMITQAMIDGNHNKLRTLIIGGYEHDGLGTIENQFVGGRNIPVDLKSDMRTYSETERRFVYVSLLDKYLKNGGQVPDELAARLEDDDEDARKEWEQLKKERQALYLELAGDGKKNYGLTWDRYWQIHRCCRPLADKLLEYKAAQVYGYMSARRVAYKLTDNLLSRTTSGRILRLPELIAEYFNTGDPVSADALNHYASGLKALRDVVSKPELTREEKLRLNNEVDALFGKFIGAAEDLEAFLPADMPQEIKDELLPKNGITDQMPNRVGWQEEYTAGDMLVNTYTMLDRLNNTRAKQLRAFNDKWLRYYKSEGDRKMFNEERKNPSPRAFYERTGLVDDRDKWFEYKEMCDSLNATESAIRRWTIQQNLAKNIWKNTYMMCMGASESKEILVNGLNRSYNGLIKAISAYANSPDYSKRNITEMVFFVAEYFGKTKLQDLSDKNMAYVLGNIYSNGLIDIPEEDTTAHIDMDKASKAREERDKKLTAEAIKEECDRVKDYVGLGSVLPESLKRNEETARRFTMGDLFGLLDSWRAGEGDYAPRLMYKPVPAEIMDHIRNQKLRVDHRIVREGTDSKGNEVAVSRTTWSVTYPGESRPTVLLSETHRTDRTSGRSSLLTREIYDPSSAGTLNTSNTSLNGMNTGKLIYRLDNTKVEHTFERIYDRTYDPELGVDGKNTAAEYLNGLCSYADDMSTGETPYIQLSRDLSAETGGVDRGVTIHTAGGDEFDLEEALKRRKKWLTAKAKYHTTMARKESTAIKDRCKRYQLSDIRASIDYADRYLKFVTDNAAEDADKHLEDFYTNDRVRRFFQMKREIQGIWANKEFSEAVKEKMFKDRVLSKL